MGRSGEGESWAEGLDAAQKHWYFFPNRTWNSPVDFRSQGICTRVLLPVKLISLQPMQPPKCRQASKQRLGGEKRDCSSRASGGTLGSKRGER